MTRRPPLANDQPPTPEVPIACSVTADQASARVTALVELAEHSLIAADQTGSLTAELQFRNDPQSAERVAAFIAAERACCPFFQFSRVEADQERLIVHVSAPSGAEAMVASLVNAFHAPSTVSLPFQPTHVDARPGPPPADGKGAGSLGVRRAVGFGAVLGVACLACLVPAFIAGGAVVSGAALLSEARDVAAVALIGTGGLVLYALLKGRRQRRSDGPTDCGC
jgi:hypothetical protein